MDEAFDDLVEYIEGLSNLYNRNLYEGLDRLATLATWVTKGDSGKSTEPFYLDLSTLEDLVAKPGKHRISHLEDMAKVEALDTMGENRRAEELLDRRRGWCWRRNRRGRAGQGPWSGDCRQLWNASHLGLVAG